MLSLQDSRAWTLYCLRAPVIGNTVYTSWADLPIGYKIAYRIKATQAMLISLAPHRHP